MGGIIAGGFGVTVVHHHPPPPHHPAPPPPAEVVTMIELTQGMTAEERPHEVTIIDAVLIPVEA